MSVGAPPWVHKTAVLLVGVGAAAGAGFLGLFFAYAFGYTCGGSEGSGGTDRSTAWVCTGWRNEAVVFGGWGTSLGAPLLGAIWALNIERWWPLWAGIAVAVLDLVVVYSLIGS
jgi:hypothetical protein